MEMVRQAEESLYERNGRNAESECLESIDWSRTFLKEKFSERTVEVLLSKCGVRLHRGYLSIFLLIQTSLLLDHISFLIFYAIDSSTCNIIGNKFIHLGVQVILWLTTAILFKQALVQRRNRLSHLASYLAILYMVFVHIVLPAYPSASSHTGSALRPEYTIYSIIASQIFLFQDNYITTVIICVSTSIVDSVLLYLVKYNNSDVFLKQILPDAIFFVCINILGIYFRYINEIFIRRTFSDKGRSYVESTTKLNYEKERVEKLMLSILPRHLASRVRESLRKKLMSNRNGKQMPDNPYGELYVERHNDVSILYADVVNYTKMTSTLPGNRLVEILNELFGRFDEASEKHKVLRIKFLGDCYYCVSGVPLPNPDHAKSCVDLALEMLEIIKDVREANDLNIDMRIGVHSGSILCGILGKCKWQYDIWSKDVIIANHMEQCGRSGKVHVTKQTLDRLGPNYRVEPAFGHLHDEFLAKCNIETFFVSHENKTNIVPPETIQVSLMGKTPGAQPDNQKKRKPFDKNNNTNKVHKYGVDAKRSLKRIVSGGGHFALASAIGDFSDNDATVNKQRGKWAGTCIEKVVEKLKNGKFNEWLRKQHFCFLNLKFGGNKKREIPFLREPDPILKYSITCALFIFCYIAYVQFIMFLRCFLASSRVYGISSFVLASLLPLTWAYLVPIPQPKYATLHSLHGLPLKIIRTLRPMVALYVAVCLTFEGFQLIKLLHEGALSEVSNNAESSMSAVTLLTGSKNDGFLGPWQIAEGYILAIIMSVLFIRINFQLKLIIASLISVIYIYLISNYKSVFHISETWNAGMPSAVAHIFRILLVLFQLHLVDRQTDFMSRLYYTCEKQLIEAKDEVASTRSINKMLLQNILPIHVAEIYLNRNRSSNELYHEDYDCVSVMFASLTNYSMYDEADTDVETMERQRLHILNLIICNFDDVLLTKKFKRIEKIKVAGRTYMAACGLAPGSRNSKDVSGKSDVKVLLIIARFAAEMMRILKKINEKYLTDFGLRVGIAHGPVTAGVVGSHKPYYDIWGDTVNVASRMDSTGETGKIQIPEEAAEILQAEGVRCEWRGNIFVKGKGQMHTFYVKLTQDCFLEEKRRECSDNVRQLH